MALSYLPLAGTIETSVPANAGLPIFMAQAVRRDDCDRARAEPMLRRHYRSVVGYDGASVCAEEIGAIAHWLTAF